MRFDEQVREDVIAQMRRAIPTDQAGIRALLREPSHAELSLAAFLRETDVALDDVIPQGSLLVGVAADGGFDLDERSGKRRRRRSRMFIS